MATNSLALRFKLLGDASGLTKATRKGSKDLGLLGNASKKMSGVLKGALAGISFAALTNQLVDLAKAASDDAQGQAILAKSIENNVKGGAKLTAGVEDLIAQMSIMAAVTDDEIRPAFGYLVRATKSVDKSSRLMSVALDLAAGSGVSVQAAASALGRAYNGNLTALNKLVPGVKKLKDPLGEVEKRFKGMAKIQGDNDPFKQMSIMADEAKEEIGKVLLPEIKKLAKYLQSPEGKKMIEQTTSALKDLVKEGIKIAKWAVDNKGTLAAIGSVILGLKVGTSVINSYKTLKTIWEGLVKAGKLIKPPVTGTPEVSVPTGGTPGGKTPIPTGTPKTPKGGLKFAPPSAAVTVSAAATAAVAVYGSTMVDLYKNDKKKFADTVKAQIARAKAYSSNGYYSASELLVGGASGTKTGAPINFGGSNLSTISKDTYNIKIEGAKLTGEQIVALLRKYSSKRGKSAGRFVDLG